MLFIAICTLLLLGAVNFFVCRKPLYPPTVFCFVWAADLIVLWFAGDFFYRLSASTLVVFMSGAVFFSAGSALCFFLVPKCRVADLPRASKSLSLMVFLLVLSLPLLYHWISSATAGYQSAENLFIHARIFLVENQSDGSFLMSLFSGIVNFSVPVAMLALMESGRSRRRAVLAIFAAVVTIVLTGARAGIVVLLLACICIHAMRTGKLFSLKIVAAFALSFVLIMGIMAVLFGKGESANQDNLRNTVSAVTDQAYLYVGGGVVGFDRVMRDPYIVPHNWQIYRFPLQVAHAFNSRVEVPSIHAEYADLGMFVPPSNVYTLYFAYLDLGVAGMMATMFFVGAGSCALFQRAQSGRPISIMLYAMVFAGICLSIFSEYFFMGLPTLLRTFVVAWLVYGARPVFRLSSATLQPQT